MVAQESTPDQIDFTIDHFRQRIQELTPPLLQSVLDAMRLGKDDAQTPASVAFYTVRIGSCLAEFEARGIRSDATQHPPRRMSPALVERSALAERARRVCRLREEGWTYPQIAARLHISERTVGRILTRSGFRTRAALETCP